MSEQRKARRLNCTVPVEGKKDGVFDAAQTIDISKGGFGFISGSRIPLNKEIALEVVLSPDDESVLAIGRVCWVKRIEGTEQFRVGLSFVDVLKGSKSRLNQYFQSQNGI